MPAVLIGIGGTGGGIINDVRLRFNQLLATMGPGQATVQQQQQYQFFLVDTKSEPFHGDFKRQQVFEVPQGLAKFGVDNSVRALTQSTKDPLFREWWPGANENDPFLPGDFIDGAGQTRLKGKLAYHLHLTEVDAITDAIVKNGVGDIMRVFGIVSSQNLVQIPVYIVCSLGGGTGSGIALTLAQHLKSKLPAQCALRGVFLLASIAQLAPATKAGGARIWSNTDTALREIDFFQRPVNDRQPNIHPFHSWPDSRSNVQVTASVGPLFDYIYLFTHNNRTGAGLRSFFDYSRLAAECVIAETFGDLSTLMATPHSQFAADVMGATAPGGSPASYASAGISSIRYPVKRIAQHVSLRIGFPILQQMTVAQQARSTTAKGDGDKLLRDQKLMWNLLPQALLEPLSDGTRYEESIGFDATFDQFDRGRALNRIDEQRTQSQRWLSRVTAAESYPASPGGFISRSGREVISKFCGESGSLRTFIDSSLKVDGSGLVHSVIAIGQIVARLEEQLKMVVERIGIEEEDVDRPPDEQGLTLETKYFRDDWDNQREQLKRSFGRWRQRRGQKGKARFKSYWARWVLTEQELAVGRQAQQIYHAMLIEARSVQNELGSLMSLVATVGKELQTESDSDLGQAGTGAVLEIGILDNVKLADHHFSNFITRHIGGKFLQVAVDALTMPGGIRDVLHQVLGGSSRQAAHDGLKQNLRSHVLSAVESDTLTEVGSHSVWDALKIECDVRLALKDHDTPLEQALVTFGHHYEVMKKEGLTVNRGAFILEEFIKNRVTIAQKAATPFWNLDTVQGLAGIGQPSSMTVVGYNAADFNNFKAANPALSPTLLSDIGQRAGLQPEAEPEPVPNLDSISIYRREGGIPLFGLSEANELGPLRTSVAGHRSSALFTDMRYVDVIDPVIMPRQDAEKSIRYALAMALQLGQLTKTPQGLSWIQPGGLPPFDGFSKTFANFRGNDGFRESLFRLVNEEMELLTTTQRQSFCQDAGNIAAQLAASGASPSERAWWETTKTVLDERQKYEFYQITQ